MAISGLDRLKKLITGDYTFIATVISVDKDEGTSVVQTSGGNNMKVRGVSVEAGNKAIIKNGIIVSPAPNVAFYEFEV